MSLSKDLPIKLRPALKSDIGFIKNAWLNSYDSSDFAGSMRKTIFMRHHSGILDRLLRYGVTMILCHPEDEDEIYTFINYQKSRGLFVLNYLYTKSCYRKLGMAKELLRRALFDKDETDQIFYTHRTWATKFFDSIEMEYDPYLMHIDL